MSWRRGRSARLGRTGEAVSRRLLKRAGKTLIPGPVLASVVRPAVRWVLSLVFGRRGYKIDIGGQGVFRLSPDFAFRGWEDFGDRHNRAFATCVQACRGKSVFVDVGAHIGLYSLPASRALGPGGRVYAFEPSESNYHYLRKHVEYNNLDNVHVFQLVVGDAQKPSVRFYEHAVSSSPLSGLAKRAKRPTDRFVERQRPQTSLDTFCAENAIAPDVVKIDVEGAELLVLRGAEATLARHKPLLFLSVHPSHLEQMGQSTRELDESLRRLGYTVYTADGTPVEELGSGEYMIVAGSHTQETE